MLDIAVDAHRAAVHDALHSGAGGDFDEVTNGKRIDGAVNVCGQSGLAIHRCDVVDALHTGHRSFERRAVPQISFHELHACGFEIRCAAAIANQDADAASSSQQRAGQVSARESGGAGDEFSHAGRTPSQEIRRAGAGPGAPANVRTVR